MALPNSGPLSLNQIHVEAGGNSGSTASINDSDIRDMIGKSSGAQSSFSEFYGASSSVTINQTISSSTNNYNMASNRGPTYSAGVTAYTLTINPGVTVGTNSTSSTSLQTGTPWSSGDTVIVENYGTVKGGGGPGGTGASQALPNYLNGDPNPQSLTNAGNGSTVNGAAFNAAYPTTFKNFGSIYGGGGGGGGGGTLFFAKGGGKNINIYQAGAGGGGGGGAGVNAGSGGATTNAGAVVNVGNAGSAGSANAGGAGGNGVMIPSNPFDNNEAAGNGGAGGGLGSDGAAGNRNPGGTGNNPRGTNAGSGGTRGYITSNSSSITFNPSGTQTGRTA